jgi:hypothetical protein
VGAGSQAITLTPNSTVSSASIAHNVQQRCNGLVLTLDGSKADYMLEAIADDPATHRKNFSLTLFAQNGDVLYQTSTIQIGNAVKDACKFLKLSK